MAVDIKQIIENSVIDAFDTMLSMPIEPSVEYLQPPESNRCVAAVSFAGKMVGTVSIQISWEFAQIITAARLGVESAEIESRDDVKDLMAELSEFVGSKLESSYSDMGLSCRLSPPSLTTGSDFTIKYLNLETIEQMAFVCQNHVILVEVGVKPGSTESAEIKAAKINGKRKAVDIDPFRELDLKAVVINSVHEVFETMLSMQAEPDDTMAQSSLEGVRTVGSVQLTGDMTGIINIHVSNQFARQMTAGMLGMDEEAIEGQDEINDLIGEISHIIGGNLKSACTDTGLICDLSTPSIITGGNFIIEPFNMPHYERLAFRSQGHGFLVEIGVSGSDSLQPETDASGTIPQPEEPAPRVHQSSPADAGEAPSRVEKALDMDVILDIPLEITVELGRSRIPIHELLRLEPGSAVSLSRLESQPVDILANNMLIAKGVVVVHNEKYGVRITEITSRLERLRSLG